MGLLDEYRPKPATISIATVHMHLPRNGHNRITTLSTHVPYDDGNISSRPHESLSR